MNQYQPKHEWIWDWPWHMAKGHYRQWFFMVNHAVFMGTLFLHVRVLGLRSLWTVNLMPPDDGGSRFIHVR